jgi:hypothetical protein
MLSDVALMLFSLGELSLSFFDPIKIGVIRDEQRIGT